MAADLPPDLAARLAERYVLRDLLGRGGMATVYLADDLRHHRVVALKVLRPDLAATVGAARFLKEIQIVARLTHPLILPLYDSGEAGEFLYYVMPYITGGSLRQRLAERGTMEPAAALAIAEPVAEALTYAHGMGILHRDIKPENILFSQGHPLVADFGIAKALSEASEAPLTRTGLSLGTPGYMSPEQAAGELELGVPTDVYSLAAVIYELIVGQVPRRWPSDEAVRAGAFLEAPVSHRDRLARAGRVVEGALVRALAIGEEQRTPTPAALIAELQGAEPKPRRRYRSDEAVAIVQRAAALEASRPTETGAMTMGGVEALGREVGIPTEMVRRAAGDHAALRPEPVAENRRNAFLGGPTKVALERVVEGELPESEFPYVAEEISRGLRQAGQVSQLGRSFTWSLGKNPGNRSVEVSVTVRAGRTRILIREHHESTIGIVFGAIGGGMGGGGIGVISGITVEVFKTPLALLAVIPLWLTTTYLTARATFARMTRRRGEQLERLADTLVRVVEEAIPPERAKLPAVSGEGR